MRPELFHDSRNTLYRVPFGAAEAGTAVTLRLDVIGNDIEEVYVRLWQEGTGETLLPLHLTEEHKNAGKAEGNFLAAGSRVLVAERIVQADEETASAGILPASEKKIQSRWEVRLSLPEAGCLLWYFFVVKTGTGIFYYGNNQEETGGRGRSYDHEPPSFQITVYDKGSLTPAWLKNAVVYQIFPDRFHRGNVPWEQFSGKAGALLHSNWRDTPEYIKDAATGEVTHYDFFGGTLEGIREKLEYLAELGINCIYLNPVFESRSNHHYDTGDYKKIDPFLGTEEDFTRLCREAKDKGIRILLDGVFSHTGDDSLYFNRQGNYPGQGAFQSPESPYFSWYRFAEYPQEYACWWGDKSLPEVQETEPSYLDYMVRDKDSVLKHWLNAGISGWRLDVADELPEEFLRAFYRELKCEDPEAVVLGEVWEDASHKISYGRQRAYLCGGKLDGVMNYVLRQLMLDFVLFRADAAAVNQRYLAQAENYPPENMYAMLNLLGSHDVERILTVLKEGIPEKPVKKPAEGKQLQQKDETAEGSEARAAAQRDTAARKRLQLLWTWQMTLPGVPSVYYGDEAGVTGGKDPDNRRTYPWGQEDRALQRYCRALICLRRHYAALRTGRMIPIYAEGDIYIYARSIEGRRDVFGNVAEDGVFFIALNRGSSARTIPVCTHNLAFGELQLMAGTPAGHSATEGEFMAAEGKEGRSPVKKEQGSEGDSQSEIIPVLNGDFTVTLPPLSGQVFRCRKVKRGSTFFSRNWLSENGRSAGILLHPTSLAGTGGLKTLESCKGFIDFLKASGQRIWQILPLNPPGAGNSPYLSVSAFAGHDLLFSGLFDEIRGTERENLSEGYTQFCRENAYWLPDYALFKALKEDFNGLPWQKWPEPLRWREPNVLQSYREKLKKQTETYQWEQYEFFVGWQKVKVYAHTKGIAVLGDMPIFVAADSADCWSHPAYFMLDAEGHPEEIAGVPPDYFSKTGQIWGNPLYQWDVMKKDGFKWWENRFRCLTSLADMIRVDHFRGFAAVWAIASGAETAAAGRWTQVPGNALFDALYRKLPGLRLVAEDLGLTDEDVVRLRERFLLPGMRLFQFHLQNRPDGRCDFSTEPDCVAYTGTHDNNTLRGWLEEEVSPELGRQLEDMLGAPANNWNVLAYLYGRQAAAVIVPLQDYLELPSSARMNVPGTTAGNWGWKVDPSSLTGDLAEKIKSLVIKFNRL